MAGWAGGRDAWFPEIADSGKSDDSYILDSSTAALRDGRGRRVGLARFGCAAQYQGMLIDLIPIAAARASAAENGMTR